MKTNDLPPNNAPITPQNSPKKRGGARPGAGRKPTGRDIAFSVRISQEAYAILQGVKNKAEFIDKLILNSR